MGLSLFHVKLRVDYPARLLSDLVYSEQLKQQLKQIWEGRSVWIINYFKFHNCRNTSNAYLSRFFELTM